MADCACLVDLLTPASAPRSRPSTPSASATRTSCSAPTGCTRPPWASGSTFWSTPWGAWPPTTSPQWTAASRPRLPQRAAAHQRRQHLCAALPRQRLGDLQPPPLPPGGAAGGTRPLRGRPRPHAARQHRCPPPPSWPLLCRLLLSPAELRICCASTSGCPCRHSVTCNASHSQDRSKFLPCVVAQLWSSG